MPKWRGSFYPSLSLTSSYSFPPLPLLYVSPAFSLWQSNFQLVFYADIIFPWLKVYFIVNCCCCCLQLRLLLLLLPACLVSFGLLTLFIAATIFALGFSAVLPLYKSICRGRFMQMYLSDTFISRDYVSLLSFALLRSPSLSACWFMPIWQHNLGQLRYLDISSTVVVVTPLCRAGHTSYPPSTRTTLLLPLQLLPLPLYCFPLHALSSLIFFLHTSSNCVLVFLG